MTDTELDDGGAWYPLIPEELTDPKGACRAF